MGTIANVAKKSIQLQTTLQTSENWNCFQH